jgi:hypothetical protein
MLVEPGGIAAYALEAGSFGAPAFAPVAGVFADAACADLDGDGDDEIVAVSIDGSVIALDGSGAVLWTSPETFAGASVDTGDLDADGDVDLVVAEAGTDHPIRIYWNSGEVGTLAFEHVLGPVLGSELRRIDLTRL